MSYIEGSLIKSKYQNGQRVICSYMNGVKVWSAGNTVIYQVDDEVSYSEEVNYGDSCLSPTTFVPTKSGYSFLGWRQDTMADSNVLGSLIMGDSPITLYAVFYKVVSVSYVLNTEGSITPTSGTNYYNNGAYGYMAVTLATPTGIIKDGYTFNGWLIDGQTFDAGQQITLTDNKTATAQWTANAVPYTVDLSSTFGDLTEQISYNMNEYPNWTYGSWTGHQECQYSHTVNKVVLNNKYNSDYPYVAQILQQGEGQVEFAKNEISTTFDTKHCQYLIIEYESSLNANISINSIDASTTVIGYYGKTVIDLNSLGITGDYIVFKSTAINATDTQEQIKYKSFRFDTTNS